MTDTEFIQLEQKATTSQNQVELLLENVERIEQEAGISQSEELDIAEEALQAKREALEVTLETLYQQAKLFGLSN